MRRTLVQRALAAVAAGTLTAVAAMSGSASASSTDSAVPGALRTPTGLNATCAQPAEGQTVNLSAPGQATVSPAPDALANGWMVAGRGTAPRYVRYLHADFWVPKNPTNVGGQTVFLFPGLQDPTGSAIFQPVLQWGPSAGGGGSYWAIASWVVTSTGCWVSPLRRVYAGDHLYGSIFAQNCSSNVCDWTVWTNDVDRGYSTTLKIRSGYQLNDVHGLALEAYNLNACAQLPASYAISRNIFMSDAAGTQMRPQMSMSRWTTACSVLASVSSLDGWVNIRYNGL
jgi:hypothetical protein